MKKNTIDQTRELALKNIAAYEEQIRELQIKIAALRSVVPDLLGKEKPENFELIPVLTKILQEKVNTWVSLDEMIKMIKDSYNGYSPEKSTIRSTLNYQKGKKGSHIERKDDDTKFYRFSAEKTKYSQKIDVENIRPEDIPF